MRGRIGYAWDRLLLYGTGGFAYGKVKLAGMESDSGTVIGIFPYSGTASFGTSNTNVNIFRTGINYRF